MAYDSNNVSTEKLDKNKHYPWKFKIRSYLIGKILWGYVSREEVELRLPLQNAIANDLKAWKTWNAKDKNVMFLILQNVTNGMIGHVQDLETSKQAWDTLERLYNSIIKARKIQLKEAWDILEKLYSTKTKARKIQLKNELNNMKKNNLSINDYVLKIK